MRANVEFHFDFGSPNAYLAHRVIPAIEARTGAKFAYVPVLLGGVFKLTGNASPAVTLQGIRNKPEYQRLEMKRFLEHHGISDFVMNPHFPVNTLRIMRGAVVAARAGLGAEYIDAVFRHMWVESRKMDEPEVIRAALAASGLDAEKILTGTEDPAVKSELLENTQRSVDRGVFGSPSFFVGDELYFGKDRLRDVEAEIVRQSNP
jgi:2-hydroxychromene-2-carboxylate isomerase